MSKTLPLLVLLLSLSVFAQTTTTETYSVKVDPNMGCTHLQQCTVTNEDGSHTWYSGTLDSGWVEFYGSCVGTQYTTYNFTSTTFRVSCNNGTVTTAIEGSWHLGSCYRGVCFHMLDNAVSSITASPEVLHSLGVPGY